MERCPRAPDGKDLAGESAPRGLGALGESWGEVGTRRRSGPAGCRASGCEVWPLVTVGVDNVREERKKGEEEAVAKAASGSMWGWNEVRPALDWVGPGGHAVSESQQYDRSHSESFSDAPTLCQDLLGLHSAQVHLPSPGLPVDSAASSSSL